MTIPTAAISLDEARSVIRGAFEHAAANGLKPLCVAVLDAGGHLIAFERQDGVPNRRFDIAVGKAHGAISIGANSRALGVMAVDRPHFIAGAGAAIGGSLVPVAGGVLVMHEGRAIGAVGISGDTSDNDEAAAMAGIRAAGLSPQE